MKEEASLVYRKARHQLRNCLGVIRGFSELLIEEVEPGSDAEAHFRFIVATVEQAQKMVDSSIDPADPVRTQEILGIFLAHVDLDISSIQRTIEVLLQAHPQQERESFRNDLGRMRRAANELNDIAVQLLG